MLLFFVLSQYQIFPLLVCYLDDVDALDDVDTDVE